MIVNQLSPTSQVALLQQRLKTLTTRQQEIQRLDDPVDWIQKYFYVPELKGPMKLWPYQQAVLREATRKDESGNYLYSTIVWSDIKKSIKSCIAAGVGLWRAFSLEWGQVIMVANDLEQANSRVGYYMRRAIELNPVMKQLSNVIKHKIELPNHTFLQSVPIDPSGEAGSNADMIIFSELWGAHQEAQQRMWTEMTLPPAKFGQSFRWVETYAGYSGESLLLEQLYEMGVRQGENIGAEIGFPDLPLYRNGRLLVLWNDTPRLPWQTKAYYASEESILSPSEFLRVHRNQWSSAEQEFIEKEMWEACRAPLRQLTARKPLVFGLDAGVSSDCFAIVGVTRIENKVVVVYSKRWIPPRGKKLDFAEPEKEIRRLAKEHNVLQWAYDEYQLHDMATRLRKEGLGWFRAFPQGEQRAVADKGLYDIIRGKRLEHNGDPVLTEHILNADAVPEGKDERKLRLVKRAPHLKIDLAVALSMASHEALRLNVE